MRNILFPLVLLVINVSCKKRVEITFQSDNFNKFISRFELIDFPFIIETENQYPYYMKYDSFTDYHYRDTIYKNLDTSYLSFLYEDKNNVSHYSYRAGKIIYRNKESLGLFYIRDSLNDEGELDNIWLFLITYKLNGELIDRITLAGYYFDVIYQFCSIDKDLGVIVKRYKYIPEDLYLDAFKAELKYTKYQITDKGIINKILETDTIDYFKYDNGRYVNYNKVNK